MPIQLRSSDHSVVQRLSKLIQILIRASCIAFQFACLYPYYFQTAFLLFVLSGGHKSNCIHITTPPEVRAIHAESDLGQLFWPRARCHHANLCSPVGLSG